MLICTYSMGKFQSKEPTQSWIPRGPNPLVRQIFFWIMSITFHMIHKFQHFFGESKNGKPGMPRYRKYRKLTLILSIIASSIYFGLTFLDYCLISDKNHQRSPSQNRITWSHLVSQPASQRCSSQSAPDQTGSRCVIVEAVEAEHCD